MKQRTNTYRNLFSRSYENRSNLRSIPTESGTFQDSAAGLLNTLPDKLRKETDYNKFVRLAKKLVFSESESV